MFTLIFFFFFFIYFYISCCYALQSTRNVALILFPFPFQIETNISINFHEYFTIIAVKSMQYSQLGRTIRQNGEHGNKNLPTAIDEYRTKLSAGFMNTMQQYII